MNQIFESNKKTITETQTIAGIWDEFRNHSDQVIASFERRQERLKKEQQIKGQDDANP